MPQSVEIALIAIGSNARSSAGSPLETQKCAILNVAEAGWRITAQSRFYETPCFPVGAGNDYVNSAIAVSVTDGQSPEQLMTDLHRIERDYGRERVERWGSRSLDLDLIAWGESVAPDIATFSHWLELPLAQQQSSAPERLILPHPRLQDRGFVLVPLRDIAPDWVHPVLGRSVSELCAARPKAEIDAIRAI